MGTEMNTRNDNVKLDIDPINTESSFLETPAFFSLEFFADSGYSDDHDAYLQKAIGSLASKSGKFDSESLAAMEDASHTNIFNTSNDINLEECLHTGQQQQQQLENDESGNEYCEKRNQPSFCGETDAVKNGGPHFNETSFLNNCMDGQQGGNPLSLASYSLSSDVMKSLSASVTQRPEVPVYASIAASSLRGRPIDFRAFLTKKSMSSATLKENPVGVFVGQLPSTYTEEDTAALLRAIGADAGVDVHVREVKSHNQRRTCAFVVVNNSALPVLLGYSKRVLCDVSCVWVVEPEHADSIKDYIYTFVRDHLRGVPKAALVLEELTPQCMRGRSSGPNGARSAERGDATSCGTSNSFFFASQNGSPVLTPHQVPMNMVLQGWNSMDVSSVPFNGVTRNSGGTQVANHIAAPGIQSLSSANVFTASPPTPVVASAPQVNYYIIGAPQNGFQQCSSGHVNGNPPTTSVSAVNCGTGAGYSSFIMDFNSNYGGAPPCTNHTENGKSNCSVGLSSPGATEALYLSSYDKNVMTCMRCTTQQGDAGNAVQVATGMPPCVIPITGMNNFSHLPLGSPPMLVQTFSAYPPQMNSRPQLLPQVHLPPPLPPPPPPQQQQL